MRERRTPHRERKAAGHDGAGAEADDREADDACRESKIGGDNQKSYRRCAQRDDDQTSIAENTTRAIDEESQESLTAGEEAAPQPGDRRQFRRLVLEQCRRPGHCRDLAGDRNADDESDHDKRSRKQDGAVAWGGACVIEAAIGRGGQDDARREKGGGKHEESGNPFAEIDRDETSKDRAAGKSTGSAGVEPGQDRPPEIMFDARAFRIHDDVEEPGEETEDRKADEDKSERWREQQRGRRYAQKGRQREQQGAQSEAPAESAAA